MTSSQVLHTLHILINLIICNLKFELGKNRELNFSLTSFSPASTQSFGSLYTSFTVLTVFPIFFFYNQNFSNLDFLDSLPTFAFILTIFNLLYIEFSLNQSEIVLFKLEIRSL